jgi:intron-binding protein aquarius
VRTRNSHRLIQTTDIILSLTRTLRPGYLRDLRRLTVALSRSRLGLYILGRKSIFESCYDIQDAFKLLFERPSKLQLVTAEMFPTQRLLEDQAEPAEMVGVEHLGQYVFEMTQAKVKQLKEGSLVLPALKEEEHMELDDDEEGDVIDEDIPDLGAEQEEEEIV